MAITRNKKEQTVKELTKIFKDYPYLYFVDLANVKTQELTQLRNTLLELGASYLMVKKNLLQIALRQSGLELSGLDQYSGSVGVVYSKDNELKVVKAISEFIKENNPKIKLKNSLSLLAGFFEKAFLDKEQANRLAKIPTREVLYGQTVNLLISPISGFAQTLNQVLVQFLMTLKEVEKTKS
ncbi:MAG: 50S ribosomal protein L10 [Patescibacteria group bacterium]